MTEGQSVRTAKPLLGVCYYPEQWPEEMWARDAQRMAETGLTYVRIGEFAWSRLEPQPGRLEFDWLRRAMDVLHAHGLRVVIGTPTATPPRWMIGKHPDMLPVDRAGNTRGFGSGRHYCFSHIGYRTESERIVTLMAEAVKDHPGLAAWQTDNEYGCHDTGVSYSPMALAGFRRWLAEKYGNVEALNEAWGTVFWSMEYGSFDEVELPNLTQCEASPTHWMDFRRYSSDQVIAYNRVQVEAIRAVTPGVPITHNYMTGHTSFDHFAIGADMEIASWDSYPLGQLERRAGLSDFKAAYARQGDPDLQGFHHDLYRAVGRGRFWIMEQQPGPVNWADHNADPLPGMARLWAWEAFAHGAEAVCYFRWRQAPFAQEQMHAGLLRPDDEPAPALGEAAQVHREIESMAEPFAAGPADCAIVFDYESAWAWEILPQSEGFSHFEVVYAQYRQLRKLGLNVDIVSPRTVDFSAYKLVFVPALFSWTDELVRALADFGGQLVIGPRSGSKTKDFHIPKALPPALSPNLLDVKVARVASLAPNAPARLKGGGQVEQWLDKIETGAERLMETEDGWPVLVRQGNVHYLAGVLDEATALRITRDLAVAAGLALHEMPEGVRMLRNGSRALIFNYSAQTRDLREAGLKGEFGLDGPVIGPGGSLRATCPKSCGTRC